jgi:O-acetyl-ADP-ribose deacetylase (regulator of RNase III)
MTVEIITGDIFDSTEKYLCHQCNCLTKRAAHLSKDVFTKYPYADIYAARKEQDPPGTIIIRGDGQQNRFIVNMLGQVYPGSPRYPDSKLDGYKARQRYFHLCLMALAKIPNLESVAFPWKIGCGAAGGDWKYYQGTIKNFATYVAEKQGTKVVIYKREFDE